MEWKGFQFAVYIGWLSVRKMIDYMHSLAAPHWYCGDLERAIRPPDLSLSHPRSKPPLNTLRFAAFLSGILSIHHRGVSPTILHPHRTEELLYHREEERRVIFKEFNERAVNCTGIDETTTDWKRNNFLETWTRLRKGSIVIGWQSNQWIRSGKRPCHSHVDYKNKSGKFPTNHQRSDTTVVRAPLCTRWGGQIEFFRLSTTINRSSYRLYKVKERLNQNKWVK